MRRLHTAPIAFAAGTIALLMAAFSARATEPLVADIDNHLVAVTAGFTGTELLVF